MPLSRSPVDVEKLRQLAQLISSSVETVIAEWSEQTDVRADTVDGIELPSRRLYDAQRTLAAAAGSIEELVCDPSQRLLGFSSQYFESRALHVVAEHRIADLLHQSQMSISDIATRIGIESGKLSRIMRLLASQSIFTEVADGLFANNRVSEALVHNEPLRAYIMNFALDLFSAADYLPVALKDPALGPSYLVNETAFNLAVGTPKPRWEWLEEKIPKSQLKSVASRGSPAGSGTASQHETQEVQATNGEELVSRPGLEIFGLAMVGGGRVYSTPHVFDYPWRELGKGTVVDVGGGQGGFLLQLSRLYPELHLVLQDRPAVIEKAKDMWAREDADAVLSNKIEFISHDFFQVNPVKGAEVYWLRNVIHDWSDSYCIDILSKIREAAGPQSRILITDQVMNTTLGSEDLEPAPKPLFANYGHYVRFSHQRDMAMMALINGIERTPAQFRAIIEAAGLILVRIWECRSQVGIVECRVSSSSESVR